MYFFIGIKGTGMSALAKVLQDLGYEVLGSDVRENYFILVVVDISVSVASMKLWMILER